MIGGLQMTAIVGVISAALAGGFGYMKGASDMRAHEARALAKMHAASARVIDSKLAEIQTLSVERDQARGEVTKVNEGIARQLEDQKALLVADQASREAAAQRMERANQMAAKENREAAARLAAGLRELKEVADECARAPVSADVKRMLDRILAPEAP